METIILTSVVKKRGGFYEINFTKNFTIASLEYEISLDKGITWQNPVSIGITSPQLITLPAYKRFSIRLIAQYTPTSTRIHSAVFNQTFN